VVSGLILEDYEVHRCERDKHCEDERSYQTCTIYEDLDKGHMKSVLITVTGLLNNSTPTIVYQFKNTNKVP
jgi:hypothetical protein